MNPLMGAAFPQMDLMGFSGLLRQAVQNPEQGAQLFSMMGIQPPDPGTFGPTINPFADLPGTVTATPQERVSQGFDAVTPPVPAGSAMPIPQQAVELGNDANPFPTPVPGANPFPTPFGAPAQQAAAPQAPATPDMRALAGALRGVSVPSAPEPQRVSSPSAPQSKAIDQNSQIVAMLTKAMSGQKDPVSVLRLNQALGYGGR